MNTCSICNEKFKEYPCNPHPLTYGECCQRCDDLIVLPLRMVESKLPIVSGVVINLFRQGIEIHRETTKCRLSNAR